MAYAYRTKVPVDRTRTEIDRLLKHHGSTSFVFGEQAGRALLAFEMRERRLRFIVPLPTPQKNGRDATTVAAEIRRRYRALLLVLKAKLEAVDSKIVTFDEEFLAHIVIAADTTVGDRLVPQLTATINSGGKLPALLGPGTED